MPPQRGTWAHLRKLKGPRATPPQLAGGALFEQAFAMWKGKTPRTRRFAMVQRWPKSKPKVRFLQSARCRRWDRRSESRKPRGMLNVHGCLGLLGKSGLTGWTGGSGVQPCRKRSGSLGATACYGERMADGTPTGTGRRWFTRSPRSWFG